MVERLVYVVGIPIVIVLAVMAVRKAIALKEAIRRHFEDEESGGVKDPYAMMAAAMTVQRAIDDEMRRSREAKKLMRPGKKGSGEPPKE